MKLIIIGLILLAVLFYLPRSGNEVPFSYSHENRNNAPANWIDENDVEVHEDRVVIYIKNASIAGYADTKSMLPTLSKNANGIEITPSSPEQIHVGDIVSYKPDWTNNLIVHRVIEKGKDEKGYYFILKGDNNKKDDPGRIRFEQIKYVTVILVY